MKIFQMKTKPHGVERFDQFIEESFVCIGWPGIGDLTNTSKDEIRDRLQKEYNRTGHQLGNALGQVNTFVNTMKTGDIVIIAEKDWAYIGKVNEYCYLPQFDNNTDGMCHRRSVEWLDKIQFENLAIGIQRLINNRNTICEYPEPLDESGLNQIISKSMVLNRENANKLDALFGEALKVLEEELKSTDPNRRVKAATELLKLKNN